MMIGSFGNRVWVQAVALTVVAVGLAGLAVTQSPVRATLMLGWISICPGLALVRNLGPLRPWPLGVLSVAVSLALAEFVSGTLMYIRLYSWEVTLAILLAVTVCGLAAQMLPSTTLAALSARLPERWSAHPPQRQAANLPDPSGPVPVQDVQPPDWTPSRQAGVLQDEIAELREKVMDLENRVGAAETSADT